MFSGKPNPRQILDAFAAISDDAAGPMDDGSFAIRDDSIAGMTLNGQTSFLRHVRLMEAFADTLAGMQRHASDSLRVLAAPISIGCETYTLSAILQGHAGLKNVETRIDGFDLSARFTFLARLGCYPSHAVRGMHAGWHNRLFANIQTMRGIAAIRRSVAAGVHFAEPQRFEDFLPAHPYDALMLNNLFMYMTRAQMDASFAVIERSNPHLLVFTRGSDHRRTAHLQDGLTALGFVGIDDHATGRASALGDANRQLYPFYIVMAHKDAGFTPVRAPAYGVLQP